MMHYTTQQGTQGICPPGWHLPTDEEWKVLEGAVDSQFGIGDPKWELQSQRGNDAGMNLKASSGWVKGGSGIDLYGFSGKPAGIRFHANGGFYIVGRNANWWTSTEQISGRIYSRGLGWDFIESNRFVEDNTDGYSVRCIKD
jgi:uncharacterized protein (TIGR02145 family)